MSSIITFYSFKGGVGRTMALANIAVLLSKRGLKVLVIDWDLEAPGLRTYFQDRQGLKDIGLLDLLIEARDTSSTPDWRKYLSYLKLDYNQQNYGELDLILCGPLNENYIKTLQDFNWYNFYHDHNGGVILEKLREDWLANYDVILIDSRTGLTDASGVCTVQLADIIVAVFTANAQSVDGIKNVMSRYEQARQELAFERIPLRIVPLLSFFDYRTEVEEASKWLTKIEEEMSPFYRNWLPRNYTPKQIIARTKIPYIAYFNFGEKLAVVTHGTTDPEGLGFWYDAMANLIASDFTSFKEILKAPYYSRNIPSLPPKYLERTKELNKVKEMIVNRSYPVGLLGMGGIGKSVLATAIAYDDDVQKAFSDGVIWLSFGRHVGIEEANKEEANKEEATIVANQRQLSDALGDFDLIITNSRDGRAHLSQIIGNRSYLIILDDVWSEQPILAFSNLGKNCQLLVTTRDRGILDKTGAQPFPIGVLTPENALELLAKYADQPIDDLSVEDAEKIAKDCGYLPLVLATVGSLIRVGRYTWDNALERLQKAKLVELKTRLSGYDYPVLGAALAVSVNALSDISENVKNAFLDCAVFPEGVAIPETVLEMLWSIYPELDAAEVGQILFERSLMQRDDSRQYHLHNIYYDYLYAFTVNEQLPILHDRLLKAYEKHCKTGWSNGPKDGYFFQHLPYHLKKAGKDDTLHNLLLDFDWIKAKLDVTNISDVINDYELSDEESPRLVKLALTLSRNSLFKDEDKIQLSSQLLGRLQDNKQTDIQNLIKQTKRGPGVPWFYPLTATLTPSSSPLLEKFIGHDGGVHAVAITPDRQYVVSGSWDKTLRLWDLKNGTCIRTFPTDQNTQGHQAVVYAVVITPDGQKIISGSLDGTIIIWDFNTGELLKTLTGNTSTVYAIALASTSRLPMDYLRFSRPHPKDLGFE